MYQFFVESGQVRETEIDITGSDVNHIRNVLHMQKGAKIRISVLDGGEAGKSYFCHIKEWTKDCVTAVIDEADEAGTEPANCIYLFQGLPKSDKMELIIQKAVELGVYQVIPVAMKHCVVKLDEKKAENRRTRWQTIAESAAKQSKRTMIPEIALPLSWEEALLAAGSLDVVLVPYENERGMEATREVISAIRPGQSIGILIGPEGGFAPEEIGALSASMHRISLGKRILRTETAGLAALAMLIYALEE